MTHLLESPELSQVVLLSGVCASEKGSSVFVFEVPRCLRLEQATCI